MELKTTKQERDEWRDDVRVYIGHANRPAPELMDFRLDDMLRLLDDADAAERLEHAANLALDALRTEIGHDDNRDAGEESAFQNPDDVNAAFEALRNALED